VFAVGWSGSEGRRSAVDVALFSTGGNRSRLFLQDGTEYCLEERGWRRRAETMSVDNRDVDKKLVDTGAALTYQWLRVAC
jgi:hypothetical protein